ncbi:hypothetical protein Droror1_Dr00024538 [Drosera rotundifolia]
MTMEQVEEDDDGVGGGGRGGDDNEDEEEDEGYGGLGLLVRHECYTFANGEYIKAGLAELEFWCGQAKEKVICPNRIANPFELRQVKKVKKEDEEFIKIEKDDSSSDDSPRKQFARKKILKAGEKIRELEFKLKKVDNALKRAESENATLKHELYLTNPKFRWGKCMQS